MHIRNRYLSIGEVLRIRVFKPYFDLVSCCIFGDDGIGDRISIVLLIH
jgi:hypothetical protein